MSTDTLQNLIHRELPAASGGDAAVVGFCSGLGGLIFGLISSGRL